jgi:hypothetical protein
MADEFSGGFFDFGGLELSREPREALNPQSPNNPTGAPWQDYYRIIAGINTAFRAIDEGDMVIRDGGTDVTMRARTFGKLVQGLSHGMVSLIFDQGYVSSEITDFEALSFSEARALLRPYTEVRDTAIVELEEAISLAQANTFTLPSSTSEWIPGIAMSNLDLVRLAHTYIARFMVYSARNPAERAAVDWNEVLSHLDEAITSDFAPVATPGIMSSVYKQRISRQRTTTPSDFARADYQLVGPADVSDGFVTWTNAPVEDRVPFRMTAGDRRIDGVNDPRPETCASAPASASCGLYFGFHQATIFNPDRGTAQRSFYFYHRWGRGTSHEDGPIPIVTVAELDLLRAEGLIRLNRAAEAIPFINKTRVANGQLPAVTIDGAPGVAPDCVPRRMDGSCGSLWDALRYEKRIETAGLEGGLHYYDARGWGALPVNTMIHLPMPVVDLELLQIPIYTFGGGQAGSAPEPEPEKCPVVLPRCT